MASPLDPQNAPEGLGKPRKAKRSRWLLVLMGSIALLALASWWHRRPLARIPLPDGGELLLVEARYGPGLHLEEPVGLGKRIRHLLSSQRNTPLHPRNVYDMDTPDQASWLWLFFDNRDPNWQPAALKKIAAVEMTSAGPVIGDDGVCTFDTSTARRQYVIVGLGNYPRRSRQLHLQLTLQKEGTETQVVEASMPNPFPIVDAPVWTPEPLPQVRKLMRGEIVLKSLARQGKGAKETEISGHTAVPPSFVIPAIEFREPNVPSTAFRVRYDFADATGNTSHIQLPPSEAAWKIHVTVTPNVSYPFPASEMISLERTTIPGPGEFRMLALPPDAAGTVRHAALVGPGEYRVEFEDDVTIAFAHPPTDRAQLPAAEGVNFGCIDPQLLMLSHGSFLDGIPGRGTERICRAALGTGHIAVRQRQILGATGGAKAGMACGFDTKKMPHPGTELEIQFITAHQQSVDFFVRPPQQ